MLTVEDSRTAERALTARIQRPLGYAYLALSAAYFVVFALGVGDCRGWYHDEYGVLGTVWLALGLAYLVIRTRRLRAACASFRELRHADMRRRRPTWRRLSEA